MLQRTRLFFLSCFTFFSIAVSQPLFEQLGNNAEFFIVRGGDPLDIVSLVAILAVILPTVLIFLTILAGRFHPRLIVPARLSLLFLMLFALTSIGINRSLDLGYWGSALSIIVAGLIAWGYARQPSIQKYVLYISPIAAIVPILFLTNSSISKLLFGGPVSTPRMDIQAGPSVVLIVFDEFPLISLLNEDRKIDRVRYPNFAALAEETTWYPNATTVADSTSDAIPAILTGKYPKKLQLPVIYDHPQNLFTLLGTAYELNVFETATRLCPRQIFQSKTRDDLFTRMTSILSDLSAVYLHMVTPSVWRKYLPPVGGVWGNFWQKGHPAASTSSVDRGEEFRAYVAQLQPQGKPTLYYLHSLLPHEPWQYLASGERTSCSISTNLDEATVKQEELRCHLEQVGFVDLLLGELIAKLKQSGIYERSLVIVTADHGRSFDLYESRRAVRKNNYKDMMLIPFFVKKPYQREAFVINRNVETVDILPTIADLLGVSIDWADGVSLLDSGAPERKQKRLFARTRQEILLFEPLMSVDAETMEMKVRLTKGNEGD